ncbi:hypothetical protein JCM10450v2_004989 [Rhodotorula kratochvilovae]
MGAQSSKPTPAPASPSPAPTPPAPLPSSARARPPPSLDDLPLELLALIAGHVQAQDRSFEYSNQRLSWTTSRYMVGEPGRSWPTVRRTDGPATVAVVFWDYWYGRGVLALSCVSRRWRGVTLPLQVEEILPEQLVAPGMAELVRPSIAPLVRRINLVHTSVRNKLDHDKHMALFPNIRSVAVDNSSAWAFRTRRRGDGADDWSDPNTDESSANSSASSLSSASPRSVASSRSTASSRSGSSSHSGSSSRSSASSSSSWTSSSADSDEVTSSEAESDMNPALVRRRLRRADRQMQFCTGLDEVHCVAIDPDECDGNLLPFLFPKEQSSLRRLIVEVEEIPFAAESTVGDNFPLAPEALHGLFLLGLESIDIRQKCLHAQWPPPWTVGREWTLERLILNVADMTEPHPSQDKLGPVTFPCLRSVVVLLTNTNAESLTLLFDSLSSSPLEYVIIRDSRSRTDRFPHVPLALPSFRLPPTIRTVVYTTTSRTARYPPSHDAELRAWGTDRGAATVLRANVRAAEDPVERVAYAHPSGDTQEDAEALRVLGEEAHDAMRWVTEQVEGCARTGDRARIEELLALLEPVRLARAVAQA